MSGANCTCGSRAGALAVAVADALGGEPGSGLFQPRAVPSVPAAEARRRLWEVAVCHHCVLLGAAFDATELRRMFRRGGYSDWRTASDYELHSSAVCFAKTRNDFSKQAQRALEERFAGAVNRLAVARTDSEVLERWRAMVEEGEAVGAYWAALTHPACDADVDEALSREMHLIAHEEFAARRATLRQLRAREERNDVLLSKLAAGQEAAEALRREIATLREALSEARGDAQRAQAEVDRLHSGDAARAMQARQAELEAALNASRVETAAARRALREAERRLETGYRPVRPSRPEAPLPVAVEVDPPRLPDLSGRRVLCIGGKTALAAQYRALVEAAGGDFAHHDGGTEDHVARLPAMLGSAELVICLAGDCSHAAYRIAKRYCKAKGKPCALTGSSSVTAVARCVGALGSSNKENEWNRQQSHSLRFISGRTTATSGSSRNCPA